MFGSNINTEKMQNMDFFKAVDKNVCVFGHKYYRKVLKK